MSQSEKQSPLEERIGLYYQEEASRIPIPQGLSQRIVEKAASPSAEKPTRRRGFRLLARGAMAAAATAALVAAALLIWPNVQQGTSTVSAEEILQRVDQTYQMGQPSEEIPVAIFSFGPVEGQPGETTEVVLTSTDLAEVLPVLREHYGATVASEETLEGRDQYVLLLVPQGEDVLPPDAEIETVLPPGAEIKLWVDKETNLIHQMAFSISVGVDEEAAEVPAMRPESPVLTGPGFSLTVEEGATYASLLEDLSERYDVTVTSEETVGSTIHYVLSLIPKADQEDQLPVRGEVWVDIESGKVTHMSFVNGDGSVEFESGPAFAPADY